MLLPFAAVQTSAPFAVGKVSSADPYSSLYPSVYSYSLIVLRMSNFRVLSFHHPDWAVIKVLVRR